jgi:acyl dehydratase
MAERGVYPEPIKKMLEETYKTAETMVGWVKLPNRLASEESIKRYVPSLDPFNPLWFDDDYAANTRWGTIIAAPFYQYEFGAPMFVLQVTPECGFLQTLYIGEDWEFFKPVRPGDSFRVYRRPPQIKDVTPLDGKGPHIFALQVHDLKHINQKDELVDTMKLFTQATITPEPPKELYAMPEYKYTREELEYLDRISENEEVRGANPRYWEDVSVGEEPIPVIMGPTTIADNMMGGGGGGRNSLTRRQRVKEAPWRFVLDPDTGVYHEDVERHMSDRIAQLMGDPCAFHGGAPARSLMARLITNWMGDDGFLRKYSWRHVARSAIGDTLIGHGKVANKRVEDGEYLVDLKVYLEDIRGNVTEACTATVSLLAKEVGYTWK